VDNLRPESELSTAAVEGKFHDATEFISCPRLRENKHNDVFMTQIIVTIMLTATSRLMMISSDVSYQLTKVKIGTELITVGVINIEAFLSENGTLTIHSSTLGSLSLPSTMIYL
jgi:hypothetical protein